MTLAFTSIQLSAFWDGASAIATVAAALVAILTLRALRRDSAERSRPLMSADLRPVVLTRGTSELVIENLGQSVAKNIKVFFNPPLPDLQDDEASGKVTPFLRRRYEVPIPSMPPGRQLFNVYSVGVPDSTGVLRNDEPTPEKITIHISYEDSRGRSYTDTYNLSLQTLQNETQSRPSSADEDGLRRRGINALEAIASGIFRM